MDNVVDVVIDDDLWNRFDMEEMASSALDAVATKLDLVNGPYELSILACDDARIASLDAVGFDWTVKEGRASASSSEPATKKRRITQTENDVK